MKAGKPANAQKGALIIYTSPTEYEIFNPPANVTPEKGFYLYKRERL